jgi:hypothetical protein
MRKLLPETNCFVLEVQCFLMTYFRTPPTRRQSPLAYLDFRFVCGPLLKYNSVYELKVLTQLWCKIMGH